MCAVERYTSSVRRSQPEARQLFHCDPQRNGALKGFPHRIYVLDSGAGQYKHYYFLLAAMKCWIKRCCGMAKAG